MSNSFVAELQAAVGADHVLIDADVRRSYETDWTGRYSGTAAAVVRPGSTTEVAEVLQICSRHDVAVIPQAGNTGLVGGGVPRALPVARAQHSTPTIILSMRQLDSLGPVDGEAMQVTVGAGVTIARWRAHARAAGFDTPLDFAARDSATIGGAIATNAGGSRVLRYGTMRQQVVGVEAVLASGHVIGSLAGLPKETAGLHWPSLLAGSEGTLAVVTQARLRLVPWFRHTTTALVSTTSLDAAIELLGKLRSSVPSLDGVEILLPDAMSLVSKHLGATPPVDAPTGGAFVLIDCADRVDPSAQLFDVLSNADEIAGTAIATDSQPRQALLSYRDRLTEAIAHTVTINATQTFKLDVAVPVRALAELMEVAENAAQSNGAQLIAFGHLAEGNMHLNFLGADNSERIAQTVLRKTADLRGTISAEHGIGVAKMKWLHLIRTDADLAAQAAIKAALDPAGILNPGVLIPQNVHDVSDTS